MDVSIARSGGRRRRRLPSRMEIVLASLRLELVDLHGQKAMVEERIRQMRDRLSLDQAMTAATAGTGVDAGGGE